MVIRVIGRERMTVPAGTFDTIVLQPIIKTKGMFSENGEARIWLTDDASRVMVKDDREARLRHAEHVADLTPPRPRARDRAGERGRRWRSLHESLP